CGATRLRKSLSSSTTWTRPATFCEILVAAAGFLARFFARIAIGKSEERACAPRQALHSIREGYPYALALPPAPKNAANNSPRRICRKHRLQQHFRSKSRNTSPVP